MGSDQEFLGLPIPVWNLLATILLAAITGVYVVLTRGIAKGSETAARAALASLDISLEARFWKTPEELADSWLDAGIVEVRNDGATVHLHEVTVRGFIGEGSRHEDDWKPFSLKPVSLWGSPPWLVHKGEHRTFSWPVQDSHPVPGTLLVTIGVTYSIGADAEKATVNVPLDLSSVEAT